MNWMKFRPVYFLISGVAIVVSLYAIIVWGFELSIDFTGGTIVEYREEATSKKVVLNYPPEFTQEQAVLQLEQIEKETGQQTTMLRFETVGPTLSKELLQKTYVAIALAAVVILSWIAWQFKSIQFGLSALFATLHDTIILLGTFAILGKFAGIEVDILFVTALLTVLSFSVHDTIVVYDRIRELSRRTGETSLSSIANYALTSTMVRSVNNSLTIVFMLFALFLMGGGTIKWFVFALLVGTIAGTYSSPFVAVPLLVVWEEFKSKRDRSSKSGD